VRAGAAAPKGGPRGRGRDLAEEGGGGASFGTLVSAGAFAVAVLLGVALAGAALASREQQSVCLRALQEQWPHKRCHGLFRVDCSERGRHHRWGPRHPLCLACWLSRLHLQQRVLMFTQSIAVPADTMARVLQRILARSALWADGQCPRAARQRPSWTRRRRPPRARQASRSCRRCPRRCRPSRRRWPS